MDPCPSAFAWDDHEIHGRPFPEAVHRHLEACDRCRSDQRRRDAWRQAFGARVSAPLRQRVEAARRRPRWVVRGLSLAGVAVAGLLLVVGARRPAPGTYVGAKGAVAVEVAGRRGGQVFSFEGGAAAEPGDEIQLSIRAASPLRYVLAGSVDGTGRFSPFYPASLEGRSVALPEAGRPLEPPVVLDDAPGPERLVLVLSAAPLDVRAVAQWAESAADRAGATGIPDAPSAIVRWLTLPKRPEAH